MARVRFHLDSAPPLGAHVNIFPGDKKNEVSLALKVPACRRIWMRMECGAEDWRTPVFVPLSAWVCLFFFTVCVFLCRRAFQGRALWWKAAHGWIILLPSFCLADSYLYSADGGAAFPPAPPLAAPPHLPSPLQKKINKKPQSGSFLSKKMCRVVVVVFASLFVCRFKTLIRFQVRCRGVKIRYFIVGIIHCGFLLSFLGAF